MTMERWVGKVAIVTGASSGIGEAIARAFVGAGMNVMGLARRQDKLKEISESLKNSKGSFHYARCDMREEKDILEAFAYVEKEFGGVDVLVNNAGIVIYESISEGSTENFRTTLDVNILAATICTREAIKSMRARKVEGYIFNINSVLGLNATIIKKPISLYTASKFAMHAMTQSIKFEILQSKDKIRVTGIYPGLVKTDILGSGPATEKMLEIQPYLESEHIADCVIFALGTPTILQLDEMVITPLHTDL